MDHFSHLFFVKLYCPLKKTENKLKSRGDGGPITEQQYHVTCSGSAKVGYTFSYGECSLDSGPVQTDCVKRTERLL